MNVLEKFEIVDRIGRVLQQKMTYSDIDKYLREFGVDTRKETSGANSKWVYVKDLLSNEPATIIAKIATELGVDHEFSVAEQPGLAVSKFWHANAFRLFLSHVSSFKKTTAILQKYLIQYGISSFVAHEDIEPTREWQTEIEKALFSMDALAAILTEGFDESQWTDQEVGVAIGRDVLIIPIRKDIDPYGFISKFQALTARSKNVPQVAREIFDILASHPKTRGIMAKRLIDQITSSSNAAEATQKLEYLGEVSGLDRSHWETLRENIPVFGPLWDDANFVRKLNRRFDEYELEALTSSIPQDVVYDNDIPF